MEALKSRRYQGLVVVALDADEAGARSQEKLVEALTEIGIDAFGASYPDWWGRDSETSDAAAVFAEKPEALRRWLQETLDEAVETRGEEAGAPDLSAMGVTDPLQVLMGLERGEGAASAVPTGIAGLDEVLSGGLRPGLVVLGGLAGMGKTTFVLQMADRIAASGRLCLFVSAEMSARELVAKSVARMAGEAGGCAISALEVMDPALRAGWDARKRGALAAAMEGYRSGVAPFLRFLEPAGQPSAAKIREVAGAMAAGGEAPVVFVDYVQILAPLHASMTEKQAVDENVLELRQMARDLQVPVVAVSSLNRVSYAAPVGMGSFKESGAIEYGADVLLALQPARKNASHACDLVVLKNRYGAAPGHDGAVPLAFDSSRGLFEDAR